MMGRWAHWGNCAATKRRTSDASIGNLSGCMVSAPSRCHSEPPGEESRHPRADAVLSRDSSCLSMTRGVAQHSEEPVHDVQADAAECRVCERLGYGANDLKSKFLPQSHGGLV